MRVYPKPGMRVRDPVKRDYLPDDGRDVDDADLYWLRRLADGDVVDVAPKGAGASRARNAVSTDLTNDGSQTA
ncbi:DUF2635 domain-containing protein [Luteibacter aegosomatis]|uniref:DUF2635 domain-containing protein n=1 Tax=Luteibacter aegosomatis TaxID=2911537 RepID=UPI001FF79010|nr:DUF2635 domain-containing protein [Luteibacter aegosomatis]UPG86854.1 DUF2635 domain-containing protein [Luteibacter aegosomatis]